MNPRLTVGLLVVFLALAGYVYFGSPPASTGGAAGKEAPPDSRLDIWQLEESDIQAIVVRRDGQEAGVERAGDEWRLLPSGDPSDRLRVNSLVFRLASLRASRRLTDASNPAEFGLAAPSLTMTLRLASGETQTLELGSKAPAEAGTYARKAGDPTIYVVSNALAQDIERLVTEPPIPPSPTPAPSPSPTGAPASSEGATPTPTP